MQVCLLWVNGMSAYVAFANNIHHGSNVSLSGDCWQPPLGPSICLLGAYQALAFLVIVDYWFSCRDLHPGQGSLETLDLEGDDDKGYEYNSGHIELEAGLCAPQASKEP